MKQITYQVKTLTGETVNAYDEEKHARIMAEREMAEGRSVYILRTTTELLALYDAAAMKATEVAQ